MKYTGLLYIFFFLVSCDTVKSTLGMDHYQADEFNLETHKPLSIPPNYDLVPPYEKDKDGKLVPLNEAADLAKKQIEGENRKINPKTSENAGSDKTSQKNFKDNISKWQQDYA